MGIADGAKNQAGASPAEKPCHQRDRNDRPINHDIVIKQQRTQKRDVGQQGNRQSWQSVVGNAHQILAKQGADADAENCQRKTCGDLAGLKTQHQNGENDRQGKPGESTGDYGQYGAATVVHDSKAADRAEQHHAFHAQVQHTGFFRHHLANGGV